MPVAQEHTITYTPFSGTAIPATGFTFPGTVKSMIARTTFVLSLILLAASLAFSFLGQCSGGAAAILALCPQGNGVADGCSGAQTAGSVMHANFFTSYVAVSEPIPPTMSSGPGSCVGTCPSTLYCKASYVDGSGESFASYEASRGGLSGSVVATIASPPQPPDYTATGWNVYCSGTMQAETKQNGSPIAIGTKWTEPPTGLVNGAAVPTSNTAGWVNYGAVRPSWNVAGVDYPVGYSGTLTDPISSGALPGCSHLTGTGPYAVHVDTAPCTFDHLDFSLHNGICVNIDGGITNGGTVTFTNDKFAMGSGCNQAGSGILTVNGDGEKIALVVEYSEFDGSTAFTNPGSLIGTWQTGGSFVAQYNAFYKCPASCLQINSGSAGGVGPFTWQYNYAEYIGSNTTLDPSVHANWEASNACNNCRLTSWADQFNTIYQPTNGARATTLLYPTTVTGNALSLITSYVADHNIVIARPGGTGGQTASYIDEPLSCNNSIGSMTFTDNYVDQTGTFGLFYPNSTGSCTPGSIASAIPTTCKRNINLLTGSAITGNGLGGSSNFNCTKS
jgi:hypothetical protein